MKVEFFIFMSKTMLQVCWSFILWSMFYLEGCWSSGSSYFIGIVLESKQQDCSGVEFCSGIDHLFRGWPFISHEGTASQLYTQSEVCSSVSQ